MTAYYNEIDPYAAKGQNIRPSGLLKGLFCSGHSIAKIAKSLGRGYRSVNWKVHELGLFLSRLNGITQWDIDMARALRCVLSLKN